MSGLLFVGVAAAGGVGAAMRFMIDRLIMVRTRGSYPWGITIVNLSGSLLIGVLAGYASMLAPWVAVLGVGLLGGYTTFSAVSVEVALALGRRDHRAALLNGGAQLVAAVALAALGMAIGRAL